MSTKILTAESRDGTRIAYDRVGSGQVVILVLGALESRKSGAELAKLLSTHFTAISYDRRGRGDSTDTAPYSSRREVEDVEALVDAVGGPVCLYGHSSGGAIALQAADKLATQVKKLAVYEVPYSTDGVARKAASGYDTRLKELLRDGRNGEAVALLFRSAGASDQQIQAMKLMPMWRGLELMAPTLAYDSEVMGEGHALPSALLARIVIPTLVMHGGAGVPFIRDAARAMSEAIPKAQFRTLAGQTHGVEPRVLASVLEEFFS